MSPSFTFPLPFSLFRSAHLSQLSNQRALLPGGPGFCLNTRCRRADPATFGIILTDSQVTGFNINMSPVLRGDSIYVRLRESRRFLKVRQQPSVLHCLLRMNRTNISKYEKELKKSVLFTAVNVSFSLPHLAASHPGPALLHSVSRPHHSSFFLSAII